MAVICLEGPSGVGKTTIAALLAQGFGATVVPEVNLLFERKGDEPKYWYFDRQADRLRAAREAAAAGCLAALDGDPFQQLWYNWAYGYDFGESAEAVHEYYAMLIEAGRLNFPDRYFILGAREDALRFRKENDRTRTRKNFERHLRFIGPQRAYFEFLSSHDGGRVRFIENENAELSARLIAEASRQKASRGNSFQLFSRLIEWLSNHMAEEFTF